MNEILNQIKARKSVRLYEDRPVPDKIREVIFESAFQAPTAGAMMLYSIINVTDSGLKQKLSVTCDNQPFISSAPLVLVFLADYQRWYDSFEYEDCAPRKPGMGDLLLACADTLIAAQNTVVAAESLGLGSCYIGDIIENGETIRELLNLPDYVIPAAMVVYGYPQESQKTRKKPQRFDREYIVFENTYKPLSKEEHTMMFRSLNEKAGHPNKDIHTDIQAFCKRKYMSDFALEMNRSAEIYLEKFMEDR